MVAMKHHELPGQQTFDLFGYEKPKREQYAEPCPIREWCGAYHCDTGGCEGKRGWCSRARRKAFDVADCPLELKKVGKKSFCAAWDKWTNCRVVGHCVFKEWEK